MAEIVTCPSCGAQYVGTAVACADCAAPLVSGPVLDPSDDEVGYDLGDWDDAERLELARQLASAGIASRWEGVELVVLEASADRVEELIDEIDHPDALDAEADDDDGGAEILSALYVAADVLKDDPTSAVAVLELLEASERAAELGPPYGLAGDVWRELQRRSEALADLLADLADGEEVRQAAVALRDAVRPLV